MSTQASIILWNEIHKHIEQVRGYREAAKELAELERDAARYRWLRSRLQGEELERLTGRWPTTLEECDAAIDAKLKG